MSISVDNFKTIQKGTKVTFLRGGIPNTIIATGKPRSVKNGTIQKATFKNADNLNGCKFFMYYRIKSNFVSLAFGDMSANEQNLTFL
jgi:hypothetical protein